MKKLLLAGLVLLALLMAVGAAARNGYMLPQLGALLNLFAPPKDLWEPLAQQPLKEGRSAYSFNVTHKYPGKYSVYMNYPRQEGMTRHDGDIAATLTVSLPGAPPFVCEDTRSSHYWGSKSQGLTFCPYMVPKDIPAREQVHMQLELHGDTDAILQRYGPAELRIKKGSDK